MRKNSKILKKREKTMQKYCDKINAKISRKENPKITVELMDSGQTENKFILER